MSGASGGVVFAPAAGVNTLSRFGPPVALTAGAVIPAGAWYVPGAFSVTAQGAAAESIPGGYCISDGVNVTITAAGNVIPIGA